MKKKTIALFMIVALCLNAYAQKTKTYALLLAVQNYPENALTYTVRDVIELGQVLKTANVETSVITGQNVVRSKVEAALDKLIQISEVKPFNYNFIFYFSGHGNDGFMAFYDEFYYYRDLFAKLAKLKAKNVFVFVDNCHSGSAVNDILNKSANEVNPKMTFFSSCRKDETSIDGALLAHGLFTQALLKGIKGYSDKNKDRAVTVREAYQYIYNDVVLRCQKYNELPVSRRTRADGSVSTYNMHPQLFGPGSLQNEILIQW
jgi:uncharacterized caspase-like protein